jgi:hypothetical protein
MFLRYGQYVIIGVVAFAFLVYALNGGVRNLARMQGGLSQLSSSAVFLGISLLSVVYFFIPFITKFDRILSFGLLFAFFLASSGILATLRTDKKRATIARWMAVAAFILIVTAISLMNLYPSPRIVEVNQQVTTGELEGMDFFFSHRDDHIIILEWGIEQERFYDAIYGSNAPRNLILYETNATIPIPHFGYDRHSSFGDSYDSPRYFLLTNLGRQYFPTIFPRQSESWRFTPLDFNSLMTDSKVNLIISNGQLETYMIEVRA